AVALLANRARLNSAVRATSRSCGPGPLPVCPRFTINAAISAPKNTTSDEKNTIVPNTEVGKEASPPPPAWETPEEEDEAPRAPALPAAGPPMEEAVPAGMTPSPLRGRVGEGGEPALADSSGCARSHKGR